MVGAAEADEVFLIVTHALSLHLPLQRQGRLAYMRCKRAGAVGMAVFKIGNVSEKNRDAPLSLFCNP
jgi:hypothetical protein